MTAPDPSGALTSVLAKDRGRLLSVLIRELRDFQLAEDCLHDAAEAALAHWGRSGVPRAPDAWLLRVARRKAIDRLRRDKRFKDRMPDIALLAEADQAAAEDPAPDIPDERLRLIFTCCHPALDEKSRVALTLRSLGGLTTEEIAAAFLDKPTTMGQRLSRAKAKIATAAIPYRVPEAEDLPERLAGVMRVIYLTFNEGYRASQGGGITRVELSDEAIRLARVMVGLMPDITELRGLLALMLLHDARRATRQDPDGVFVPLEHQDRSCWDKARISEGVKLVATFPLDGAYQLQAAISAEHTRAAEWADTDWALIAEYYARLEQLEPNPVVRINRVVALCFAGAEGLADRLLAEIAAQPGMDQYQPFFVTQAEVHIRQGDITSAANALRQAIDLTASDGERTFLKRRLAGLEPN